MVKQVGGSHHSEQPAAKNRIKSLRSKKRYRIKSLRSKKRPGPEVVEHSRASDKKVVKREQIKVKQVVKSDAIEANQQTIGCTCEKQKAVKLPGQIGGQTDWSNLTAEGGVVKAAQGDLGGR